MSDVNFEIDFSPHVEFVPYQGVGRSDRLPKDGFFAVTVKSLTPQMSKTDKPMALFAGITTDTDIKGASLVTNILCGGKDINGGDLGRQFMEFLYSAGTSTEKIQANAKAGAKIDAKTVFASLIGKTVYGRVEADVWEGVETSRITGWISEEDYKKAELIGAHRKDRKVIAAGGAMTVAAQALNLGGAANGARPTGASALPNL